MDGGLNRLSRGRFTNYSTEQGLRSNDVTAILCRGPARLGRHDRRQPAPGAERPRRSPCRPRAASRAGHAHQILDDGRGSIWMTGERGITRLERSELLKVANSNVAAATARVYDFRDGFGRWEFQGVSQSSGVRRADGIAGVPERDRRRHRPQRGVRQVDRRAVREGARGARRRPARPDRRRRSCCRRASSSSRCATRRPAWRCRAGCCSATSWKAPTPAGSTPGPAAPRSTRT